jgi:hypothetical protein
VAKDKGVLARERGLSQGGAANSRRQSTSGTRLVRHAPPERTVK